MTTRAAAAVLALAGVAACSSPEPDDEPDYLLNALPGPEGFDRVVRLRRGSLEVEAKARLDDGIPVFELDLENRGAGRLTISRAGIRVLSEGRVGQESVDLLDEEGDRQMQVILLGHERRKIEVRPTSPELWPSGPVILEVRAIRDERGEGGLDFDLRAVPPDEVVPEIRTVEK